MLSCCAGRQGASWANFRGDGFKKRMAEIAPAVKILGEQWSQNTPADGLRLMEDFMQTYPRSTACTTARTCLASARPRPCARPAKAARLLSPRQIFRWMPRSSCEKVFSPPRYLQQSVIIGRWCIRASINQLEKRAVPKQLWTPIVLVSKENLDQADFRGVRAPEGWKPPATVNRTAAQ